MKLTGRKWQFRISGGQGSPYDERAGEQVTGEEERREILHFVQNDEKTGFRIKSGMTGGAGMAGDRDCRVGRGAGSLAMTFGGAVNSHNWYEAIACPWEGRCYCREACR